MSEKNPCAICGDEAEYLRFLDSCAERANEIWRENEVKTLTDVYKSMDFVQVVRCRDCATVSFDEFGGGWCNENCREVKPWDFCAWGERRS